MKKKIVKYISYAVMGALLIPGSSNVLAQSYIGGGLRVTRTTNSNVTFPGGYVEAGLGLPAGFQARFLGEFAKDAELGTIFTRDLNSLSKSTYEMRFKPTLRYSLPFGPFKPFIESGVEFYRQGFEGIAPSRSTTGLNPLLGAGFRVSDYEGSYARIFADQGSWNNSRLEGHRVGLACLKYVKGNFGVKFSGEFDRISYREEYQRFTDWYREKDSVIRGRIGFVFGGRDR